MYSKIVNPTTGRKVNVNSQLGKDILRRYLEILTGGSGANALSLFILDARERRTRRQRVVASEAGGGGGGDDAPKLARDEVVEAGVMGPADRIMDFVGPPEVLVGMLDNRVSADESGIPERETFYYEPLGAVSDLFEVHEQEPEFQYTIIKLEDPAHIMDELIPNYDAFLLLEIDEMFVEEEYDDIIEVISNQILNAKIVFIDRENPVVRPIIIRRILEEADDIETIIEQVERRLEHVDESLHDRYVEALNSNRFHYTIDLDGQRPGSHSRFTVELQLLPFTARPTQLQLVVNLVMQ